jgi:hyperosmotically inducible periplasmic protein
MRRTIESLSAAVLPVAFLITLSPAYQQNLSAAIPDSTKAAIAKEVRHELVTLPYYGVFDNLGFRVNDDASVTLFGQVNKPVLKDNAGRVVKRVQGVTGVKNEIEVLPLSPNDDRIRRAAFKAIYGDSALSTRYAYQAVPSIHILVKNGNITLEGVVANQMDKTIAGIRANALPGVFSVTNNLRVEE